jgi:hypothetical protein
VEVVCERDISEVLGPEEERALCGRATEVIVP